MDTATLRLPRLISLFLAWAWGIIAGSVALNAIVKSNQSKSRLRRVLPGNARVDIDTDDVLDSGAVVAVVCALIAVLCTIYLLLLLSTFSKNSRLARVSRASESTLPIQWMTLAFCAVWVFATQIPFTVFFANNSARIRASIGNLVISQEQIAIFERLLGVTSVYRHLDYLRLVAIMPWFTILFTAIAAVVCFVAAKRYKQIRSSRHSSDSPAPASPLSKERPEEPAKAAP
ncbi:hypothetical protein L218DRAFT_1072555 [Marasmius fiardii PR-910]|nr:hypothetical protein L218DRAFT_1072555 [Marasmius fiardii PR-910]